MHAAKVTSKGQITIPAEVRNAMELKPGTKVVFYPDANGGFVMRASTGSIMDLRGILAGFDLPKTDKEMNDIIHQRAFELDEATKTGAAQTSDGEAA
jgi:antitoxin PrlF